MEHILFFQMIYRNVSTTKFGKKHVDPILYTPLLLHVFNFIIRFIFWMFFSSCWIFDHGWEYTNGPKNFKKSSQTKKKSREIKQINFTKIFFSNIFIQKLLFCEIDFQKKNMIIDENAFHSFLWSLTIIFPQDFCFSMELINRVGIIVHIVQPVNRP